MTAITIEHLELAALAAGMTPIGWTDGAEAYSGGRGLITRENRLWNPAESIADAARLAVRLRLAIGVDHAEAEVVNLDGHIIAQAPHNGTDDDAERAYCEAVTIGAAAIGLRMREGGR